MPLINKPTRYPANSAINPTLLDHIWVNYFDDYMSGIIDYDLTDHCPVFIRLKTETSGKMGHLRKLVFRSHNDVNIGKFISELKGYSWNFDQFVDVSARVLYFDEVLQRLYNESCPVKTKYVSAKSIQKPWITKAIIISIKTKSIYFKLFKLGLIDRETNINYRNTLTSTIRNAKRRYFCRYFDESRSNIKKTWDGIRRLIGSGRVSDQVSIGK